MENKHTPGPWRILPLITDPQHIKIGCGDAENGYAVICRISKTLCPDDAEANAFLIAAAPDLLEFVEITLSYLPPEHMQVKRALELIAKAKGTL